jgi:3-oxoacyl-[acyl-carrier protein] reductase
VCAAQEGAQVVVHYNRSREGAEQTLKRIEQAGSQGVLVQADITSWDAIRAMADAAFAAFGGLDVAVNNVGDVARDQMSWRDITEESIDHVLAVDVKARCCAPRSSAPGCWTRAAAPSSTSAPRSWSGAARGAPQYAAAKYGILGITKSYAAAFAPTVRVNTFAPGFIETQATLSRQDWKTGRAEKLRSMTPMGRIPRPEEVAGTALFLATADAGHITGTYLVADGGYNMVGA